MNSPPTPTAPTKSLRRSDIKQLRRRLTCSAIRVWQQYTDVEKRLSVKFLAIQRFEVAQNFRAEKGVDDEPETAAIGSQLVDLREEAQTLSDLATWYKSGHEQLNSMIAFAEQTIKEMA